MVESCKLLDLLGFSDRGVARDRAAFAIQTGAMDWRTLTSEILAFDAGVD